MVSRMLTVLILLVATFPATAQGGEALHVAQRKTATRAAVQRGAQTVDYFNVAFDGGSLQELCFLIQEQNDRSANIVLADEIKDATVPPLQLQEVTMHSLAETLHALNPRIFMTLTNQIITLHGRRDTEEEYVIIYNIQQLVDQEDKALCYSLEDIATTIETAWNMYKNRQSPEMKIHEGTFLMIVQGTRAEQQIVEGVLGRLTKANRSDEKTASGLRRQISSLRQEINGFHNELKQLSATLDRLKREREDLRIQSFLGEKTQDAKDAASVSK